MTRPNRSGSDAFTNRNNVPDPGYPLLQLKHSAQYKAVSLNPSPYLRVLWLFFCFSPTIHASVWGQTAGRIGLSAWEDTLIRQHTRRYQQTRKLASQHGWPLRKNYSSQRILSLQSIDSLGQPVYYTLHNSEAAQATRTESLYSGGSLGINLSGNASVMAGRLGMWDGGQIRASHQEFAGTGNGRISNQEQSAVSAHATHVAGTLIARGVSAEAKGMAYGATLRAIS